MSPSFVSNQPWWIWIAAFILLQLSSEYSIFFLYTPGTADVYLTFSVGIILIYWLGPRVLILAYLNALIDCYFWGHEILFSWPIFALPETLFFFLSWYLFIIRAKGKYWLPDLNNVIKFLVLGIAIPLTIYMFVLKFFLILFKELDAAEFWSSLLGSWMGDFMPTIIITLPILYYFSKRVARWLTKDNAMMGPVVIQKPKYLFLELFLVFTIVVILSISLDFDKYWYLFGLMSLIISVRNGFGATSLVNFFILFVIYLFPASIYKQTTNLYFNQSELLEIYLGINLLSLFSIISGRVISDYRQIQKTIQLQMNKVEKINTELDSFVYSVSHDLIAPLKSIKGLTNLMRADRDSKNNVDYINRIEESTNRLDHFIGEILDFSRNSRVEITKTTVDLELMIKDIIANHRFIEGFNQLNFDLSGIKSKTISVDEMRLRIILNNLISNAIKFSNGNSGATVKFITRKNGRTTKITVEDNGCGIADEYQDKIFEMFYRASNNRSGSGLGLYIAKESANKINAKISVESNEGKGSKFTVSIPG